MKKWIVAAAVLLLIVVGVIGFAAINLNSYLEENRELVQTKISETLGRDVRFESLSLSFRGGLSVRVESLSVSDDPAYADAPFVAAQAALARVRIWPALRGEIDVARVSLLQPSVALIRDDDGWNAQTLAAGDTAETEEPATTDAGGAAAVAVALFDIEDGTLTFVDRTAEPPFETTFEHIDFSVSDLSPDTPMHVQLSASLLGADDTNLTLKGTAGPVDFAATDATPLALSLYAGPLDAADALQLGRTFGAPADVSMNGAVAADVTVGGTVAAPELNLSFDATEAAVDYGDAFRKPEGVRFTFACEASMTPEAVNLPAWSLRIAETEMQGDATLGLDEAGAYRATVRSEASPLAPLLSLAGVLPDARVEGTTAIDLKIDGDGRGNGPNMDGEIVLTGLAVQMDGAPPVSDYSTRILVSSDTIVAEPAALTIGKSPARFDATVRDFSKPNVAFSFESQRLSLADVDPASFGEADTLAGLSLQGKGSTTNTGFDFGANLKVASGSVRGIDFDSLNAKLAYAGGVAKLEPLNMNAYGGKLEGTGEYVQNDDEQPRFSMDLRATGLDAGRVVSAQTSGGNLLEGTLDGRLRASGKGLEWETVRTSLDGDGGFSLTGGRIRDVNVAEEVLRGITGLPGLSSLISPELKRKHPGLFSTGDTAFEDLSSKFKLEAGRMFTDDLDLRAADYGIRGKGSIGLDGSVDMSANLQTSEALTRSLVSEVDAVKYMAGRSGTVEIPFRLTGVLPAVRAQPDTRTLAKALEGALVGGIVDQLFGAPKPRAEEPSGPSGSQKKNKKKN